MTATPTMTSNETIINGLTYIASASDPPVGVEFFREPWRAFQNVSNQPRSWAFEVPEDSWIQLKYLIPLSMKGFYIIPYSETYSGVVTMWNVLASNDGIVFDNIVPPNTTQLTTNILHEYTFPGSANYAYWRFNMILTDNTEHAGILMVQWIPTLPDRFYPRKFHVGYIPRLLSNANYCEFAALASPSTLDQPGFKAFKGDGSEQLHPFSV